MLFGVTVCDEPLEEVRITVLATGFERSRRPGRMADAVESALPAVDSMPDTDLEVPTFLRGRS